MRKGRLSTNDKALLAASMHDMLCSIACFLGISKSDLSLVCGVSRPTLYAWFSKTSMPQHFHAERIVVLHKLVENTGWDGTTSLHAPFVYEKLTGYHRSLRDELISFPLDESLVEELLSITWRLTLQRRAQLTACLAVAKFSLPT